MVKRRQDKKKADEKENLEVAVLKVTIYSAIGTFILQLLDLLIRLMRE